VLSKIGLPRSGDKEAELTGLGRVAVNRKSDTVNA
jgi:hypothetical protein